MATSRWTVSIFTTALILMCAGCNSGSTSNVTNPPPPPAQGVSIAFQSTPPTSVVIGTTATFSATVTNDSANAGVDWNLSCPTAGSCGALSTPHTASGQPVTYTPPSSLAGNTEIINLAAYATADHTKNVLASFNLTAYGSNLSGTYVFQVAGAQGGTTYQAAGVIVLDGNGNVTSGQQTLNFLDPSTGSYTSYTLPIVASGSSYFLGPDGRGTLTLVPNNSVDDPSLAPEIFNFVYLSNSHLLITAAPNSQVLASASGTMDLQTSTITTALSGGYSFVLIGTDFNSGESVGLGGVLNIDNQVGNPNDISGTGSVVDQNFDAIVTSAQPVSGNITIPVSPGVVTLTLNFSTLVNGPPSMTFVGYIVDQNHIQLIESDNGGFGSVAGLALGQGSSTGTFTDASFSGTYILGATGMDLANGASFAPPNSLTSVASFTANGAGNFSNGYTDTVYEFLTNPSTGLPAQMSVTFNGNYSVGTKGRVSSSFGSVPIPNNDFRPVVYFYLGGDGTALVLMNSDVALIFPMVAAGRAYPQSTSLNFSGSYGVNFIQQAIQSSGPTEYDATGTMSVTLPSLSGIADIGTTTDQSFVGTVSTQPCASVTAGCFSASLSNGTASSAFQGANFSNPNMPVAFTADFYSIDATQGYFVENDLLQQNNIQVSFGSFSAATLPQVPSSAKASQPRRK